METDTEKLIYFNLEKINPDTLIEQLHIILLSYGELPVYTEVVEYSPAIEIYINKFNINDSYVNIKHSPAPSNFGAGLN